MGAASSILSPQGPDGRIVAPAGYVTPKFPGLYPPTLDNDAKNVTRVEGEFLFRAEDVWHFTLYWCIIFHTAIFLIPAIWSTLVTLLSPTSSLTLRRSPIRKFDNTAWEQAVHRRPSQSVLPRMSPRSPTDASPRGVAGLDAEALEMSAFRFDGAGERQLAGETASSPSVPPRNEASPRAGPSNSLPEPLASTTSISTLSQPAAPTRRSRSKFASHLRFPSLATSTAPLLSLSRRRTRDAPPPKPPHASAPIYLALVPLLLLLAWATLSALIMGTILGFTLSAVYTTANFEMSTWVPFLWALIETCIVVISCVSGSVRRGPRRSSPPSRSTYSTVTTIL